jgi:hypothetical protein
MGKPYGGGILPSVFGGHFISINISLLEKMRDFRPIPQEWEGNVF